MIIRTMASPRRIWAPRPVHSSRSGAQPGTQIDTRHDCSSRMSLTGPISRHGHGSRPGRPDPDFAGWYGAEMPELRGTVVLATYNSGASVGPVLAEIEEAAAVLHRSGIELDVLLVDDSSPDNTATIATDEAARLGLKIEVLNGFHLGVGRSQLAGFEHLLRNGDRDFFVTLDPD